MDIVKLNWPRSFHRQKPFPLEDTELFDSFESAETYALSGDTSYVGQLVTVVDEESSAVTVYKINFDRALSVLDERNVDAEEVKRIVEGILAGKNYTTLEEASELVKRELSKLKIPANTSDLNNDSGFITIADVNVPTKVSELENDAHFITGKDIPEIPTKVSQLENDANYLTEHQDLTDYAKKTDLNIYAKKADIPSLDSYVQKTDLNDYAKKTDIPSLDDYAKKTDIPSLDEYAKKTDIPSLDPYITKVEIESGLSAYTKTEVEKLKTDVITLSAYTKDEIARLNTAIEGLPEPITYTADGKTIEKTTNANNEVVFSVKEIEQSKVKGLETTLEELGNKVTKIYRPKGSVETFEELPTNAEPGDVYNVVQPHENVPAGTNYAWVDIDGNMAWDPLGGTVDLSAYITKEDSKAITDKLQENVNKNSDAITGLTTAIGKTDTSVTELKNTVNSHGEDIKTIKTEQSEQDNRISSLQSELSSQKESIANINNQISDINATIEGQTTNINTLQETVGKHEANITTLTEKANELDEQLKNLDVGVKTVLSKRKIFDNSMDEFTIEAVGNNVSIKLNGFDGGEIAII